MITNVGLHLSGASMPGEGTSCHSGLRHHKGGKND